MISTYVIVTSPLDEVWHQIYGVDITAWSLPHLTLFSGLALILFAAIPQVRSAVVEDGRTVIDLRRWQEWIAVLLGGVMLGGALQVGTAEWDTVDLTTSVPEGGALATFLDRPAWLLPVVIVVITMFSGGALLGLGRRVGLATMAGVIAVTMRLAAMIVLDGGEVGMTVFSQVAALACLFVVDLLALRQPIWTWRHGLVGAALAVVGVTAAVGTLLEYPTMDVGTASRAVLFGMLLAPAASRVGWDVGGWFRRINSDNSGRRADDHPRKRTPISAATS